MRGVIAGAGGYGQVYLEYLSASPGLEIVGFVDDDKSKIGATNCGVDVLGKTNDYDRLREVGCDAVFAPIGDNRARVRILEDARRQGFETPAFVHSSAIVPTETIVGDGVYILPGTIVMPFVKISDFVMISVGARIAHHTTIGKGAFLSTGVNLGASVNVGIGAFLGIGSTVMTGVGQVGDRAVIGAGAVVIRDVPAEDTVVGNPARAINQTPRSCEFD